MCNLFIGTKRGGCLVVPISKRRYKERRENQKGYEEGVYLPREKRVSLPREKGVVSG